MKKLLKKNFRYINLKIPAIYNNFNSKVNFRVKLKFKLQQNLEQLRQKMLME